MLKESLFKKKKSTLKIKMEPRADKGRLDMIGADHPLPSFEGKTSGG